MFVLRILIFIFLFSFSNNILANPNSDQWKDDNKSYKDLIEDGFEVKAYDMNHIEMRNGYIIMFFVTVLQKNNEVYECQEYQTLDENMTTLDLSLICRKLVQPYELGVDT
tara:strand:- start:930 stop:1259 length:330 start_codon:yes stop_codon:yes gene_type:complete